MTRNSYPFDKLFAEHDASQIGGLTFEDFVALNETVEVSMNKQDLKRVFGIIDKNNSRGVTLVEVRSISAITMAPEEDKLFEEQGMNMPDENLKGD